MIMNNLIKSIKYLTSYYSGMCSGTGIVIGIVAGAILLFCPGCNIATPVLWLVEGPPSVEAMYQLPPDKSIVVFLDDRATVMPRTRLRRKLTMSATQYFLDQPKMTNAIISPDTAIQVTRQEGYGSLMPIDEIGRKAGADLVIYATVTKFSMIDNNMPKPTAMLNVKVIDSATGEKLWPKGIAAHSMLAQMGAKTDSRYEDTQLEMMADQLAEFTGMRLAQLFFKHEEAPFDGGLNY